MYSRASTFDRKEKILRSLCDPEGKLRIIVATNAFGMGVDCPDIRTIYHWGAPSTLEEYAQETGRAGRDGQPSQAVLFHGKSTKYMSRDMIEYCDNSTDCRCKLLYNTFYLFRPAPINNNYTCCDVCCK
jgi:superfamily II DNA helicase RecQ